MHAQKIRYSYTIWWTARPHTWSPLYPTWIHWLEVISCVGVILGIIIEDGELFWNNLGIANQEQCVNNENILEDNMCYVERYIAILHSYRESCSELHNKHIPSHVNTCLNI